MFKNTETGGRKLRITVFLGVLYSVLLYVLQVTKMNLNAKC